MSHPQLQVLHRFAGPDGSHPFGSLFLSGPTLYGMTQEGGSNDQGVIFALDLAPKLAISVSGTNVNLSWSANFPNITLESTGQLTGTWVTVCGVAGQSAILPIEAGSNRFFRLKKWFGCSEMIMKSSVLTPGAFLSVVSSPPRLRPLFHAVSGSATATRHIPG